MTPYKNHDTMLRLFLAFTLALLITGGALRISAPVNAESCPIDLLISEYIEGSDNNKVIELYNGTGRSITLTGHYSVALYTNGSATPQSIQELSGSLADGEAYVIANASADQEILDKADVTSGVTFFNGNDAIVLYKDGVVIDALGQVENTTYWGEETTLVRKSNITAGDPVEDDVFDPADEWDSHPQNTFNYLGSHTIDACGAAFSISKAAPGTVASGTIFTYTLTVENATGITPTTTVITDVLPNNVTFITASHGGGLSTGNVVSWTVDGFADGATLTRTFQVTATGTHGVEIQNADYGVNGGSDWLTTTQGATVTTQIFDCGTIYGLQYPGGTSLCSGETVTVTGVVYGLYDGNDGFAIAEASGAWHGIYVNGSAPNTPDVGDRVDVVGTVEENFGRTQITYLTHTVINTGTALYAASVISTAAANDSEAYEGSLVEVQNVIVTDENPDGPGDDYNEWEIDDGSGAVRVNDLSGYDPDPQNGETFEVVRGMLDYSYGNYKIEPRDADDVLGYQLALHKSAPSVVNPGALYTYTLTVENNTGSELTHVVLTDTVPTSTTFAYALDNGVPIQNETVVSWTVDTLPSLTAFTVRFAVTATNESGLIQNADYAVSAENYPTATHGVPVGTRVSDETAIHDIQGDGTISPLLGQSVTGIYGIVTTVHAEGFYMQNPHPDANAQTSEGIFVYLAQAPSVSVGDAVHVDGSVDEYYNSTQIENASVTVLSSGNTIPPTQITLPEQTDGELEHYEGMLVTLPHTMTVAQNYFQGRYGQLTLSTGGRMYQPTHLYEPGSPAFWDQVTENARRMLILDDGSSEQNPHPIPYIGVNNTLRAGDIVSANVTGVIDNGPITSGSSPNIDYRLHPTGAVDIERVNTRPSAPTDVGGRLQVASFNVLNYFNGDGMGGGFPTARGADTLEEFERQRSKIITAVLAIDADVVGLMEIENDGYDANSAIADLINGLNDETGANTYAYIDPDVARIGTDEIAVGLIYKPGSVTPMGDAAILDNSFDPDYIDTKNRPALAQTFEENATGEQFTAVVNHLKSKGSSCDSIGDPDTGDGQGNCNLTRTSAMSVEVAWLATDPTNSGDPDVVILGDLNAYAQEDPIMVARDAGYTDLIWQHVGSDAYTYIFDGESGYLDYALANDDLVSQVTGATIWHINTDEPSVIDYNTEFKSQDFYTTSAYRASDHDPVIFGLNLRSSVLYLPLVARNSD